MILRKNTNKLDSKSSESLGNDAYEWLIDAITTFKIPTGSKISENKLAELLGFSRTPVREALKRLENEGLVRKSEAGRFTVAMLTAKDVDEAIDLLILCDTFLFQKAVNNLNLNESKILVQSTLEMSISAKNGDRENWSRADLIFHETVMKAAGNDLISETARITRRRIQRFWARSASGIKDLITCSAEHKNIAEAIIQKDRKKISKEVEVHLGHLRVNMHEIVASTAHFFESSL